MPPVVQPRTIIDYANDAANYRTNRQQGDLNQIKLDRAPQQMAMEDQKAQMESEQAQMVQGTQKQAALKGLATDFKTRLQAAKITDPALAQQYLDQYVKAHEPYIKSMGFPMSEKFTLQQVEQIAGATPTEQNQAELANKKAEMEMKQPFELEKAEMQYAGDIKKSKTMADYNANIAKPQQNAAMEMNLADDFYTESKEFKTVSEASRKLDNLLDKASVSPAATLAAATSYMKLLDPGSVVRESELGMALNAQGIFGKMESYVNQLATGKVLTPDQVADFKQSARKVLLASQGMQQQVDKNFTEKAIRYGLNPKNIVREYGQNEQPKGKDTNIFANPQQNASAVIQGDTGDQPIGSVAEGSNGKKYRVTGKNQFTEVID